MKTILWIIALPVLFPLLAVALAVFPTLFPDEWNQAKTEGF